MSECQLIQLELGADLERHDVQSHRGVINLQLLNNNPKALGFIDSTLSMKGYFQSVENTEARGVLPKKKGRPLKRRRGLRQDEWSLQVQDSGVSDHGDGPCGGGSPFKIRQQPESIGEIKEKYQRQQIFEKPTFRFGQRVRESGRIPNITVARGYCPKQIGPNPKLQRSHFSGSHVQEGNIGFEDDHQHFGQSVISPSRPKEWGKYEGVPNLNRDFSSFSFKVGRGQPLPTIAAHPHLRTALTTPLPRLEFDYNPVHQRIPTLDNPKRNDLPSRPCFLPTHQRPPSLDVDSTRGFRKPFPRPQQRLNPNRNVYSQIPKSRPHIKNSVPNYLEPGAVRFNAMSHMEHPNFNRSQAIGNDFVRNVGGMVFNDRVFSVYKGVYPRGRRLISKGFSDADDRRHSTRTVVMTRCKSKNEHSQV